MQRCSVSEMPLRGRIELYDFRGIAPRQVSILHFWNICSSSSRVSGAAVESYARAHGIFKSSRELFYEWGNFELMKFSK